LREKRLSDDETASVITFIYSHMINCFKGALAELLAVGPCLRIMRELQVERRLPRAARLYVCDAVRVAAQHGKGFAKGADLHILASSRASGGTSAVAVGGVAEVKSFFRSLKSLRRQLKQHLAHARRGLRVGNAVHARNAIIVGCADGQPAARIIVLPGKWKFSRPILLQQKGGKRVLHVEPPAPPSPTDTPERIGALEWHVTLRWSKEALEGAAYEVTCWFMERVGEALYAGGVPKEWSEMSPAEAGYNAAKMMLYYAILRSRTRREDQRAIALYNTYSFGYALGMNFRNTEGKREMLWPKDLDEILAVGKTASGCKIV
jgi:hypothetical protein